MPFPPQCTFRDLQWELIVEAVLSAAAQNIDITDLDLDTDAVWYMVLTGKNGGATTGLFRLYVNGNYTDANYYSSFLESRGGSVFNRHGASPQISYSNDNQVNTNYQYVFQFSKNPDGNVMANIVCNYNNGTHSLGLCNWNTATGSVSVTSIRLAGSIANFFAAGTQVRIFRQRG